MQKSGQYLFLDLKENQRKESLVCSLRCIYFWLGRPRVSQQRVQGGEKYWSSNGGWGWGVKERWTKTHLCWGEKYDFISELSFFILTSLYPKAKGIFFLLSRDVRGWRLYSPSAKESFFLFPGLWSKPLKTESRVICRKQGIRIKYWLHLQTY